MNRKTALITGASSDTGKGVALCLAEAGFNIAAHYYQNRAAAEAVKEASSQQGVQCLLLPYDLRLSQQARKMVTETVDYFQSLDVLVNVIGPSFRRDLLEVDPAEWAESVTMNLNVAFNVIYAAKESICSSRGHIINFAFAGVDFLKSYRFHTGYCAAKAGIVILTKSLAASLAPLGVRVNAICPGIVQAEAPMDEKRREYASQIPFGRPGTPREIGEVVKWLVSDSPVYVTGALISVAGGWEFLG